MFTTANEELSAFQKYERSLHLALERINSKINFILHTVTSDFCSKSSFSRVEFELTAHNDGTNQLGLDFNTLFKVEAKQQYSEALKFIHTSRHHLWPPFHPDPKFKKSEKNVMMHICSEILVPLCGEVNLEMRYLDEVLKKPMLAGIKCSHIGMGSVSTWHGTPDARVRGGVEVVHRKEEGDPFVIQESDESDDESESVSSDGMTTTIEGKILSSDANLPQVISTGVVSSFTEKSIHPDQPALVPTILIDEKVFRVCLYDSKKDVLLISVPKFLATKGRLSQSGMALLWVVLNHR